MGTLRTIVLLGLLLGVVSSGNGPSAAQVILPEQEPDAVKECRKAADAGDVMAMYSLGLMYAEGRGVPKDEAEAVKWYRKAADAGNTKAICNLAYMYWSGRGVERDYVESYAWYSVAADLGEQVAAKGRDSVVGELTAESFVAAQKRAGILKEQVGKAKAR